MSLRLDTIPNQAFRALLLVLIAWPLAHMAVILPGWIGGAPPAYPGQYLHRALFAGVEVPLVLAVFIQNGGRGKPASMTRTVASGALVALSVLAWMIQIRLDL